MINLAIVEDEDIYAEEFIDFIHRFCEEQDKNIKIKRFYDGDEIASEYKAEFDIILMDIQMRFMDGMSAAAEIRKKDSEVIIIFITNRMDYAIRGYEVSALDYIVKPVDYFSFASKLERAISKIPSKNKKSLSISTTEGIKKLELDKIIYIESIGHNLHFYTAKTVEKSRLKISDMESRLLEYDFYRINKGYIVNMAYVDTIRTNSCVLGKVELPISRNKKASFMEAMAAYLGSL